MTFIMNFCYCMTIYQYLYFIFLTYTGEEKVEVRNFSLNAQSTKIKRKKVGVLISGSGKFVVIF